MSKSISRRDFCTAATASAAAFMLAACGGTADKDGSAEAPETNKPDAGGTDTEYTTVKEGVLVVASDLDFPPLDSFEDKKAQGFDVDLSNAIGEKLGLTVEYLPPMDFDSIIPLIKQGGKADIGNSAFSITEERKTEIDFTDPYLDSNLGVAVKTESGIKGDEKAIIEALNVKEKTVAVQAGTTGEDWARENLPDASIVPLASVTVCMTGVSTGKYNAFCADLPVIAHQCAVSFSDCNVALEIATGEQYGIVVSKDNPGLTAAINAALSDMQQDGTMDTLKKKWFGDAV